MKSYNGLWDRMMTKENITQSIENAHRGKGRKLRKRKYKLLVYLYEHRTDSAVIKTVRRWIENYQNDYRPPVEIQDGSSGKIRKIYAPTVKELVIQHCIVNVLKDILLPMIPAHTYGSVPGRGSQDAVKYIMTFIRRHPELCTYCCKMDHRKYFDSIPQARLKAKLRRIIRDRHFTDLLFHLIEYIPGGFGLPIGFYTSQLLGVWYVYDSDEYINSKFKSDGSVSLYVRWMDDVYMFGPDKRKLEWAMYSYMAYTRVHQDLHIKDNYQVFRFSYKDSNGDYCGRFLDAMGYRFYCDRVILRKSLMVRMTRKAKHVVTLKDCRAILSYNGYLKVTKTYGVFIKYIKPYVNIKKCKKRISDFDRRRNQHEQLEPCERHSAKAA